MTEEGHSCRPSEVRAVRPAVDQLSVNTQTRPDVSVTLVPKVHLDLMDASSRSARLW